MYNVKNLEAINEVFKRLNNLRRWSSITCDSRYDEISKQSLNWLICYILAKEAENQGVIIVWERFPTIAIWRAFQKAYVNYDTPEHILKEICALGAINFEKEFMAVTCQIIKELTDEKLAKKLSEGSGTTEELIYKAATKIATLVEIKELRYQYQQMQSYQEKYDEVLFSLTKYKDIPGFETISNPEGRYFKLFSEISKLRNQNRWSAYSYRVECSVLGHLFDTGVFAYIMALEKGYSEEMATKFFFMGIYHDVPETFTQDIPSPIKDKIPGFRELTERYELQMMEKNVYPLVSPYIQQALQEVMFENEENAGYKALMKGADYMSAVSELCRQKYDSEQFSETILRHGQKFDSGMAEITDTAKELYHKMIAI